MGDTLNLLNTKTFQKERSMKEGLSSFIERSIFYLQVEKCT